MVSAMSALGNLSGPPLLVVTTAFKRTHPPSPFPLIRPHLIDLIFLFVSEAANLLGFANIVAVFAFFGTNYQALFYIGMAVVILSMIPTLVMARERPVSAVDAAPAPKKESCVTLTAGIWYDLGC